MAIEVGVAKRACVLLVEGDPLEAIELLAELEGELEVMAAATLSEACTCIDGCEDDIQAVVSGALVAAGPHGMFQRAAMLWERVPGAVRILVLGEGDAAATTPAAVQGEREASVVIRKPWLPGQICAAIRGSLGRPTLPIDEPGPRLG